MAVVDFYSAKIIVTSCTRSSVLREAFLSRRFEPSPTYAFDYRTHGSRRSVTDLLVYRTLPDATCLGLRTRYPTVGFPGKILQDCGFGRKEFLKRTHGFWNRFFSRPEALLGSSTLTANVFVLAT